MSCPTAPWLTLIGLHEDGLAGLHPAARQALDAAHTVFGAPRHLALAGIAPQPAGRGRAWPTPFDLAPLLALRGQAGVAVLASGDPFWHGVGGSLAAHLAPQEWRCLPQPSTFSLLAARLGWPLEATPCLGLHAGTPQQLLPHLAPGQRVLALLRDGPAAHTLAQWLCDTGWGRSPLWLGQSLGGPHERLRHWPSARQAAAELAEAPAQAPVALALQAQADAGAETDALPAVPGRPERWFAHDGQITKAPVRALTLAALAPRPGEHLWDIGSGSGSIAVEWCLAHPGNSATALEARADRVAHIRHNIARFGLQTRLRVRHGQAPTALAHWPGAEAPPPQAVFVGGGLDAGMFHQLRPRLPARCRLVTNAVTLQTQALLVQLHGELGGQLLKLDIASAQPLGRLHGWQAARTLLQWSWQT